jgi:hypothetical protein
MGEADTQWWCCCWCCCCCCCCRWRSRAGAITSAPLILGMDVRNDSAVAEVWPIISNAQALEVSQSYAGDAGRLHAKSTEIATAPNCGRARP